MGELSPGYVASTGSRYCSVPRLSSCWHWSRPRRDSPSLTRVSGSRRPVAATGRGSAQSESLPLEGGDTATYNIANGRGRERLSMRITGYQCGNNTRAEDANQRENNITDRVDQNLNGSVVKRGENLHNTVRIWMSSPAFRIHLSNIYGP